MPDFNNNRISMPRMWYDKSVCKPFDISFQRRILLESIHIFMGTAVNLCITGIITIIIYIVRMITLYPDNAPMVYYENNIMHLLSYGLSHIK